MPSPAFLPFAQPDISEEEIAEVVDSLRSGWLTTGPKVQRFEREFAEWLGGGCEAVAVSSGTAGLHLALEALGVGRGDEVVTTPYTFTATAGAIHQTGARAVFADIDPRTFNLDVERVADAVGPATRALVPVHFGGLACDMAPLLALARARGLAVVEDAAHALPATYRGRAVGALDSDATVFSFYATKPLATGEGGMVVTRDAALARRCRVLRLHGIDRDAFDRYVEHRPAWQYEVVAPGFKYNLSDLCASLGLHQLRRAHRLREQRERMARRYDEALAGLPLLPPPRAPADDLHAWHLYEVRLTDEARVTRARFIERKAELGVGCSVHFIPLHLHPYWRDAYGLRPGAFPRALEAYERAVSLPLYTKMTDADQERVVAAVREVLAPCA